MKFRRNGTEKQVHGWPLDSLVGPPGALPGEPGSIPGSSFLLMQISGVGGQWQIGHIEFSAPGLGFYSLNRNEQWARVFFVSQIKRKKKKNKLFFLQKLLLNECIALLHIFHELLQHSLYTWTWKHFCTKRNPSFNLAFHQLLRVSL